MPKPCRKTQLTRKSLTITVKQPAAAVKVKNENIKVNVKKKAKIQATLVPANSTDKVKWGTINNKIATVSQKGIVTAKSKGTVTITAKAGKKKHLSGLQSNNPPMPDKPEPTSFCRWVLWYPAYFFAILKLFLTFPLYMPFPVIIIVALPFFLLFL